MAGSQQTVALSMRIPAGRVEPVHESTTTTDLCYTTLLGYSGLGFARMRAEPGFFGVTSASKAAPTSFSIGIPDARESLRASTNLSTFHSLVRQ